MLENVQVIKPISVEEAKRLLVATMRETTVRQKGTLDALHHEERALELRCGECSHCKTELLRNNQSGKPIVGIRCNLNETPSDLSRRTGLGEEAICKKFEPKE